ncbi:MAG: hypothetical protein ACQKBY_09835 [Verrucomicrobiales bacterium]
MTDTEKTQTKEAVRRLADPDSYRDAVEACMTEQEQKRLPAQHVANVMSLVAEMIFTHIDPISEAFEKNNGLEVTFKAKLAKERDTVAIQFKPVGDYKDSAIATVDDPEQETFDFKKGEEGADGYEPEQDEVKGLPEPVEVPCIGVDEEESE